MSEKTGIAWTDHTFNPWWGCVKVSPGCTNCYAAALDKRTGGDHWGGAAERRFFGDKHWNEPRRWNRLAEAEGQRKRVFCASMADVFEDRRDLEPQRERLWQLIRETPWLDWQLLTKRPENVLDMAPWGQRKAVLWPENVWLGFTAENQEQLDARWSAARQAASQVAVFFVSCEPLLGPLRFGARIGSLDWLIIGVESSGPRAGRNALGYDEQARDLMAQCRRNGVPVFHKQMPILGRVSHNPAEWPEDLRVREFPEARRGV